MNGYGCAILISNGFVEVVERTGEDVLGKQINHAQLQLKEGDYLLPAQTIGKYYHCLIGIAHDFYRITAGYLSVFDQLGFANFTNKMCWANKLITHNCN